MQETDVINWLAGEVVSVYERTDTISLSNPHQHVGLADDRDDEQYPYVGIQRIATRSKSAGIGNGKLYVEEITTTNNLVDRITYGRDKVLRVNVIVVTDGDSKRQSELRTKIYDRLVLYARSENSVALTAVPALPVDIDTPTVEEATPQNRPDEFIYGDAIAVEIPYTETIVDDSITAAKAVNLDLDVGDTVDTAVDAIDEQIE